MGDDAYTEFFKSRKQAVEDRLAAIEFEMGALRVEEIQLRSELTKIGRMALMLADEPSADDEGKQGSRVELKLMPEPKRTGGAVVRFRI